MHGDRTIAILGGGFAGLQTARSLERTLPANWTIKLLSLDNFITYAPLLPEVVGASLLPSHVVAPLRQTVKRAQMLMVRVTEIDLAERCIHYAGEGEGLLRYDQLVIALGQHANTGVVKGMGTYSLPLKTLGDAMFLRNRVIARLEHAQLQPDRAAWRWLLSFVVIGGGLCGVETAGELLDFVRASLRYYPQVDAEDVAVQLVHSGEYLLPELSCSLGEFAERKMMGQGVQFHLSARALRVDDRSVYLSTGDVLPAGTVVCTIGSVANPLVSMLPLPMSRGRIDVLPDMSVASHPEVWSIGDCAAVPNAGMGGVCPTTAQFADRQARLLARNVAARVAGPPTQAFSYKPLGMLATVGHNHAVAELFGLRLSGFVAWLLWRGT